MAVGSSGEDNSFSDENSSTSNSNNTGFSPSASDSAPYNATYSGSEFNTSICLDESTFDVGEDTLQWLEENLLKSIQEQTTQDQDVSQHSVSQLVPISSAQNHHPTAAANTTISSRSHPSQIIQLQFSSQSSQHPPAPVRSHSYTSIATDHDYSAKPGER